MHVLGTWIHVTISFAFVLTCVLLILVILLQKGRGGGLAGAFGGGGGGYSAFGAKTGDVFTWITVVLTGLFILIAMLGNYWYVPPDLGQKSAAEVTREAPAEEGQTAGNDSSESGGG